MTNDPLSIQDRVTAYESLLERRPDSLLTAIDPEGFFVAAPPSLRLDRSRVLRASTALDLVTTDDRMVVVQAWLQVKAVGVARVGVHLAVEPAETSWLHFFDLTPLHGVMVGVLVPPQGVDVNLRPEVIGVQPSRVTWTHKNQLSEFLDVDNGVSLLLGWDREDLVGKRSLDFIHPDDQHLAVDNWMGMLATAGDGQRVRLRHLHKDGHHVWFEIANKNKLNDPDEPHVVAQMIDISAEMAANEALREREQLLHRLAEALPSGLLHVRADGQVVYTNERLHEIVGVPRCEGMDQQLATVMRADWERLQECFAAALEGTDGEIELRLRRPGSDEERLCQLSIRSLTEVDGTVSAAIISVADITEAARLRDELHARATFDALTGCHNRSAVMRELDAAVGGEQTTGVVFVDLDRFKAINDELGHATGDELLVTAADRLRAAVRPGDVVGRIGGDEFLVVCSPVADERDALDVAEQVASALRREVELTAGLVDMRASVGVACTGSGVTSSDDLVARADAAMYESKRRADGRAVPYSAAVRKAEGFRLDDERALHHALDHDALDVHFQPVVHLASGTVRGYESLVRWSRGSGQAGVTASEFIEMAEETGLIHDLGQRVRTQVVRSAASVRHQTGDGVVWFSNVSAQELASPGFVQASLEAIDGADLPRESFVLEFNCNLTLPEHTAALTSLGRLHDAGVGLALDSFGAGSATLEVLRAVPLSWVKLAPGFTGALESDPIARGLVEAMLSLATRLGITSIVKGVEREAQRDLLIDLGADLGQGHLFAAAGPLASVVPEPAGG